MSTAIHTPLNVDNGYFFTKSSRLTKFKTLVFSEPLKATDICPRIITTVLRLKQNC